LSVVFDPKAIKWIMDQIYFEIPKFTKQIVDTKTRFSFLASPSCENDLFCYFKRRKYAMLSNDKIPNVHQPATFPKLSDLQTPAHCSNIYE